jgi:hypothetical protein
VILEEYRTNLKPAGQTLLVGGIIGTVVMAVGGAAGIIVGGVIGGLVSIVSALGATGIYLYTLERTLFTLGVNTQMYRRQARRAYRQAKRLISVGVRRGRRGLRVGFRSIRNGARMAYKQLQGGIR